MSALNGTSIRPEDWEARERIETMLNVNMLVEAGAGSGKTTSLVGRMLQHVARGTPVDRIAAVTFTRKAANELQERFRNELEARVAKAESDAVAEPFARALHGLDRAFLGTIHSFCGRMLREHPLEAGLDPTFREVTGEEMETLQAAFWRRWIDRERRIGSPDLDRLAAVHVDRALLYDGFKRVRQYPDVEFETVECALPDVTLCRNALVSLLQDAAALRPKEPPADGWDPLMLLTRRLEQSRRLSNWNDAATFCTVLETISKSNCAITQKRWTDDKKRKALVVDLKTTFETLVENDMTDVVRAWREHRYPIVMRVLQRACADFERERHATGNLGFEDLLLLTARMLKTHPGVRDSLGERYAHLLVDEFQDTDPIQAEVCLLLASPSSEGNDWTRVTPRAGNLFVVGDPKQSIYRFRRADIAVYDFVKGRIRAHGEVLELTSNFRSTHPIGELVNAHFSTAFSEARTGQQATFTGMRTVHEHKERGGPALSVYRHSFDSARPNKYKVMGDDAEFVASMIAERISGGSVNAGDFLILTQKKEPVAYYARALAARNIPATTTGAALTQEHELQELRVCLDAIADPENPIAVVAALEGLFFGLSPADLWEGRQAGHSFRITSRPKSIECRTGEALARLYEWWSVSQRQPVDVLLERILDDTGLLFHATSQELGDARAGSLLHVVETLRQASVEGAGSLAGAIERLDMLLKETTDDVSLRPGRSDAVRVMNVHQAKGLEAPIVILAAPLDAGEWEPRVHVRRQGHRAVGGIAIRAGDNIVAHPVDWAAMQAAEADAEADEDVRLLYVAATRAERELVVSQCTKMYAGGQEKPDASVWRPLAGALVSQGARVLPVQVAPPVTRRAVERSSASIQQDVATARGLVEAARKAGYTVQTVTETAKQADEPVPFVLRKPGKGRGVAWGRAVHAVMEAFLRGRRGAGLVAFARATSRDEALEESLASELRVIAERLGSGAWAPIGGGQALPELTVMQHRAGEGDAKDVVTEGIIDAVVRVDGGWQVYDWKTDVVDDTEWATRMKTYERQVEAYANILMAITGETATARVERVS